MNMSSKHRIDAEMYRTLYEMILGEREDLILAVEIILESDEIDAETWCSMYMLLVEIKLSPGNAMYADVFEYQPINKLSLPKIRVAFEIWKKKQ